MTTEFHDPLPLNEGEKNFLLLHNLYQVGGHGWVIHVLHYGRSPAVAQAIISLDREQSFEHWAAVLKRYP